MTRSLCCAGLAGKELALIASDRVRTSKAAVGYVFGSIMQIVMFVWAEEIVFIKLHKSIINMKKPVVNERSI